MEHNHNHNQNSKKTNKEKREKRSKNQFRTKQVKSFTIEPDLLYYTKQYTKGEDFSKFINNCIRFKLMFEKTKKKFFLEIIRGNYSLAKHLIRQIGRSNNKIKCQLKNNS